MPNPQNLKPFPKGVSGNPGGRPKSLSKVVRAFLEEVDKTKDTTKLQALIIVLFNKGIKGDLRAITELLNRAYGTPFTADNDTLEEVQAATIPSWLLGEGENNDGDDTNHKS
jgi:hypothetical protein